MADKHPQLRVLYQSVPSEYVQRRYVYFVYKLHEPYTDFGRQH